MTLPARILIVDDEPQAIQVLSKALAGLGDLSFALTGVDALDLVATNPPDLVLLDARMPGLDGFATCAALKASQPELPVLFVTAAGDSQSELRALAVGASDYIVKPINPPLVRARVLMHLKLRQHRHQYQAMLEQLRHSEERFRKLFEDTLQATALLQGGRVIAINRAARELLGMERPEQVLGLDPTAISTPLQPDGRFSDEKAAELLEATLTRGSNTFEWQLQRADGRPFLAQILVTVIQEDEGALLHTVFSDITARKEAELALSRSQTELEEAQSLAHIGSWTLDFATNQMQWSSEIYRISGVEPGTPVAPDYHFHLVHPEDFPTFEATWQATLEGAPYDLVHRIIIDGQVKWVHARAEIVFDEAGQPSSAMGTLQDITAQKEAQRQVEYLAYNDALTGLLNRAAGHERLQHEVASASRHQDSLAVLYLDLDKFKFINDSYGHHVGDLLLQEVARRLRDGLREEDSLCRLSGDEFMVMLPRLEPEHLMAQVSATCERILGALAPPFTLADHQVATSFSIGVAVYPQDGSSGDLLMRNADTALYEAKKAGRNTFRFFKPQMNADLTRFVHIRNALRQALDQGEFELHYQPQLDLHSGGVVGVEALLRWRSPGFGLVLPDHFIPIAEESGLMAPIGRWVLGEACRQAAIWCNAGWPDLVMAVNLSAAQFRLGQIGRDVREALAEAGLEPTRLLLELTESGLLQPDDGIQAILADWKAWGIRLAIDDFGTGCSSLTLLKRLQVDKLKIDPSIIHDLSSVGADGSLIQAMIQLAHRLSIRILAEGVESADLARKLQDMDCDEAQGYVYTRPLPARELECWLKSNLTTRVACG